MKACFLVLVFLCAFSDHSNAIRLAISDGSPAVLKFPIRKVPSQGRPLQRRGVAGQYIDADRETWLTEFTVGTPAKKVGLVIDTGSSNIWVNVPSSDFCRAGGCIYGGTYDPKSRSKKVLSNDFSIDYDGSDFTISGQYVIDWMYFGHTTVPNVPFGVAYVSDSPYGIFGIGYPENQAQPPLPRPMKDFPTFSEILVNNGLTNIEAFSMWLDSEDTGCVLFGGVDRAKYSGDLVAVPIVVDPDGVYGTFRITLRKIVFSSEKTDKQLVNQSKLPVDVVLDSGTNFISLPAELVANIHQALQASVDDGYHWSMVNCGLRKSSMTLDFTFDSTTTIRIPMSALINPPLADLCELAIVPDLEGSPVLGTPFLRSAYVVYNMEDNEIALANVKPGITDSDIVEISNR